MSKKLTTQALLVCPKLCLGSTATAQAFNFQRVPCRQKAVVAGYGFQQGIKTFWLVKASRLMAFSAGKVVVVGNKLVGKLQAVLPAPSYSLHNVKLLKQSDYPVNSCAVNAVQLCI